MSNDGEVLQKQIVLTILNSDDPFLKGLRWSELRDNVLNFHNIIDIDGERKLQAFNMRMTRATKQLIKKGIIYKDELGHNKLYYKIIENGFPENIRELLPDVTKDENLIQFFIGKKYGKALDSAGRLFVHYLSDSPGVLSLNPLEDKEAFQDRFMEKATEVMRPHITELWEGFRDLRVSSGSG